MITVPKASLKDFLSLPTGDAAALALAAPPEPEVTTLAELSSPGLGGLLTTLHEISSPGRRKDGARAQEGRSHLPYGHTFLI